ncbi:MULTISPECIES: hypothetical protein [Rhodococcus]|uniref:Hypothetical membrane protein n=2 Tax=Rhodococcus opacus TaxID=37919 RepID=C1BD55_RHOOB|nr:MULTISPECIES: hypothetical protein [Rhodococcus]EID81284.1 putative membrane protein [Rhodococcus opacus RKJ300 = JCM 13270]KAF0957085.1 hypothetical protein MLGJGCBP_08915 [Rhodococcus sp. T7]KAF0959831.1 hypothetical protein MLGJGCBP_07070 [Rhodococcus sp. T7]QQZ19276.1 hypothetical protein GO592_38275 [Rhodococcus sp. 21391]UOT08050.1 hypothetical protein MPY17_37355 [Rhodococcus opacus]
MSAASSLEVEDLRWGWGAAGFVLGCAAVLAFTPLYLVLAAAALGLAGMAVFHLAGHRTAGARLASFGLGVLIPAAAGAVLVGINSF